MYIKNILSENNISIDNIELIGIAAPGSHNRGIIVKAENLGIKNFDLVRRTKKEL